VRNFTVGDHVKWTNAYGDVERGVVTKTDVLRVYVDMTTIGGRPRVKIAHVFFAANELSRLAIDDGGKP